jgi:hypothetical protein
MFMEILSKNPELANHFNMLCQTRRDEILSQMMENDEQYEKLCKKRADISMELKMLLSDAETDALFEKYSDAVYEQEIYELDAIYRQGLHDALDYLQKKLLI